MSHWRSWDLKGWFLVSLQSLLVVVAVACGAAATPGKAPAVAPAPVATPAPVAARALAATPAPAPTPTPQPVVRAAKVTFMVGQWGTERFDFAFVGAGGTPYLSILHGAIIATDNKWKLIPGIAADWGVSADGKTWTFTIRNGVKFHDGTELTVEDVLWTFRHTFSPEAVSWAQYAALNLARNTEKIEQTGPDKVSITTKRAESGFGGEFSTKPHIMPKRDKLHDEAQELAYDKNPIGTGIMKLVKHIHADVMTFERFDNHYYQPKNGFAEDRRVKFTLLDQRLMPEEATRVAALRAGEGDISAVSLAAGKQVEAAGGRLIFAREAGNFYIRMFGCYYPEFPCNDKRVRQALDYAIDKELMRDKLYNPQVFEIKGWGTVSPSTIGYTPELDARPFDPEKARKLLAEAGFPGGKGFGKLIVHTWPVAEMPFMVESAQLAADFWRRELGLDVEVKISDRTVIRKAEDQGQLKGVIVWRDTEAKVDALGTIRNNYGDHKAVRHLHEDPDLSALVQKAAAVFDPVEQEKVLKKLYVRLREESYEPAIGYLNLVWGVGPRIAAWEPYPLAFYPTTLHTISLK